MFTLLKMLEPLLLPPFWIVAGMGAGLLLLPRRRRAGTAVLWATLIIFYLLCTNVMVYLLSVPLQRMIPPPLAAARRQELEPEAIVILAGGVFRPGRLRPRAELTQESWRRLWRGLEIYLELKGKVPLIYSGGSGNPFEPDPVGAVLARDHVRALGIPEGDFSLETASRNTFESAREVRRLLDERFPGVKNHRFILVTSAVHLPRALEAMRRDGLRPLPAPCDFPAASFSLGYFSLVPRAANFALSTAAVHEWLGIAGYRLRRFL
jgi:uncharacterized SAM-binding protein YcdF (DUF218 family)